LSLKKPDEEWRTDGAAQVSLALEAQDLGLLGGEQRVRVGHLLRACGRAAEG
jgi:hypothetical protein